MTLNQKLKTYRALVRVGRDNLSDRGIVTMLSLARDPEIMAYYEKRRTTQLEHKVNSGL